MSTVDDKTREVLLAELDLHKTEFTTLREESGKWDAAEQQFLNLSIIAVGAGLGFAQFINGVDAQIILLLAPLVFHVFFREMLECTKHVTDISIYLTGTLIPRVNSILDLLGADPKRPPALGREYIWASEPLNLVLFTVQPMRYWIPVSAVIALLLLYVSNMRLYNYTPPLGQIALIILNLLFLISTIARGWKFYRSFQKYSREAKSQIQKQASNM